MLLFAGTSVPASVRMPKRRYLVKYKLRLVLHNAELADPVVDMDLCISDGIDRHKPLVIIPAVRAVDDPLVVRLDDAEVFKRRASRNDMRFISFSILSVKYLIFIVSAFI